MNATGRPVDDTLVNLALFAIGVAGAAATLLRGAAALTAWASGTEQPTAGWAAGIRVLGDPADPGRVFGADISPWTYWPVLAALVTTLLATGFLIWRKVDSLRHKTQHDPRRLVGVATRTDVATVASKKALLARSTTLRPSLTSAQPSDVGYLLGRSRGMEVWASVEDSILLLGPPRSGKGLHVVINAILDAPGAVVTTATRPDNIAATITARQKVGPVAVFDPQRLAEGLPSGLRWSPVRGCEDPLTAMIRATGLASATGLSAGGVESGGFWEGKTRTALQSLLHAAALDHLTPAELFAWTWGDHAAGAIWDASIAKVILGGTSSARDLQDLSALIGERDERTDTISVGDYGSRSLQRSTRRVPILPPEAIRTLPFGTALVLLRSAPPLVTDLRPWTTRSDAAEIRADRSANESALQQ